MFDGTPHELPPYAQAIGMEIVDVEGRVCLLKLPYREDLVGDPDTGVLHGGVITASLDNASGWAVRCHEDWDDGESMATLDIRIDYMRPAVPHQEILIEAQCYKITKYIAFVRGVAYQASKDDPVATSVAAFMIGTPNAQGANL